MTAPDTHVDAWRLQLAVASRTQRTGRAHTRVAGQRQLAAATQGHALHRGHRGLGARLHQRAKGIVDAAVDAASPAGLHKLVDVKAGAEATCAGRGRQAGGVLRVQAAGAGGGGGGGGTHRPRPG